MKTNSATQTSEVKLMLLSIIVITMNIKATQEDADFINSENKKELREFRKCS